MQQQHAHKHHSHKHHAKRRLTDKELAEVAGVGGEGIEGRGRLRGEIAVDGHAVRLITANKGTRSEVSFTLDLSERKGRHLVGREVSLTGTIHKTSQFSGRITFITVISRPTATHLPGEHLSLSGTIDNREPMAIGGEAPPSGSYLVLAEPLSVGSTAVKELFLEGPAFEQGKSVKVYGRLEARSYGGVERGSQAYSALSGISDLGAGEPPFDGVQFRSAVSGTPLQALIVHRRDLFDAPNVIAVPDPTQSKAFLGSFGGHIRPEANPFHGFSESAAIAEPTDADRAAVVIDKEGNAIDVASGQSLVKISEEQPPPGTADMFSRVWFFDDATETVYSFVSGGIAGFVNRMESVIRFEA